MSLSSKILLTIILLSKVSLSENFILYNPKSSQDLAIVEGLKHSVMECKCKCLKKNTHFITQLNAIKSNLSADSIHKILAIGNYGIHELESNSNLVKNSVLYILNYEENEISQPIFNRLKNIIIPRYSPLSSNVNQLQQNPEWTKKIIWLSHLPSLLTIQECQSLNKKYNVKFPNGKACIVIMGEDTENTTNKFIHLKREEGRKLADNILQHNSDQFIIVYHSHPIVDINCEKLWNKKHSYSPVVSALIKRLKQCGKIVNKNLFILSDYSKNHQNKNTEYKKALYGYISQYKNINIYINSNLYSVIGDLSTLELIFENKITLFSKGYETHNKIQYNFNQPSDAYKVFDFMDSVSGEIKLGDSSLNLHEMQKIFNPNQQVFELLKAPL